MSAEGRGGGGAEPHVAGAAAQPAAPTVSRPPADCLVVDDDPDIRDLITRGLSRIGVRSAGIASAAALQRRLAASHPTMVFLDVELDRWDAVDGLRLLGEHRFKGAVQLISGKSPALLSDVRAIGERHGLLMLAPLRKPFRLDHVLRLIAADPLSDAAAASGPAARERVADRAGPTISLADALDDGRVELLYQPQFELSSGRMVGAEALARVRDSVLGEVGPGAFLPGASPDELERLTEFAVLRAFRDWNTLDEAGRRLRLSVNASVAALAGDRLTRIIRECRPRSERWPGLVVEITESDAISDVALTAEVAIQLRIYDVELAIDDFGTGYSSFSRLKQFGFCEVKLDQSYVRNCAVDPVNACICRSVIDLAHAFDAVAVAEGVESDADGARLLAMGCDRAQGFRFGRPMSLAGLLDTKEKAAGRP